MPVGTKGTVKTSTPTSCARSARAIVLGNTYHLRFRPGEDVIAELGGLHALHGLGRPDPDRLGRLPGLLARATRCSRVDDDGVTFRSVYDGAPRASRPSSPRDPGAPRLRHRDVPRRLPARRRRRARSSRRPCAARRSGPRAQRDLPRAPGQLASASRRAASTASCAARSSEELVALDFDGYAIGGLSVGESARRCSRPPRTRRRSCRRRSRATSWASATPRAMLEVDRARRRHVRLRAADAHRRTGSALTWEGRLNLRNARFARDPRPLDEAATARRARNSPARTSGISSTRRRFSACGS